MKVAIISNSPGEIAGWAIPASIILNNLNLEVDLFLTPCMFATKNEHIIAENFGKFKRIYKPKETLKKIFLDDLKYDIVFQMGGDLFYSTKFKTPNLVSYPWGIKKLEKYFKFYLVPNEYVYSKLISRNLDNKKIVRIKDLAFDKIRKNQKIQYDPSSNLIGFMLGSREVEFWGLLEIYLKTIQHIQDKKFVFFVSPFIYKNISQEKIYDFIKSTIKKKDLFDRIIFVMDEEERYRMLSRLSLLITIPGTKTNEAGYLGIPQIVILPLQKPEYIPVWGIVGWLDFLGIIGKKIKGFLIINYLKNKLIKQKKFLALPNMIADKKIVEEVIDNINEDMLRDKINYLLSDKESLKKISISLRAIYEEWENKAISFQDFITQNILSKSFQ
jgi:lipid-A-disaccharide synthase